MESSAINIAIVVVYLLAMLAFGWWGKSRTKNNSDFLVAGRRLGPFLYTGTMAAVVLGGASTVGGVGLLHRQAVGEVPVLAHRLDHVPGLLGDRRRHVEAVRHEVGMGDDLVDQPDAQRRLGVDPVARQRHLAGPRRADAARQVDEHGTRVDADAQVGVGEAGPL